MDQRIRQGLQAGVEAAKRRSEEARISYNKNPNICRNCKVSLTYEERNKKFCNRSCSTSFNNVGVRRHGRGKHKCIGCDEMTFNPKYCSSKCQREYEWLLRKKVVEQTGEEKSDHVAKKYLIEKRGNKCEICQNIEWMGQLIPLVMDHINGDSSDNSILNLRLVCGNCDMQLPTYKSKNIGNGRAYRRKRYAEGKSY